MRSIFTLLFTLTIFFSIAQNATQTIRGTVRNSVTRQPLTGANVVIKADTLMEGTVTDEAGRFTFQNIPAGRYSVQITFTGFASYRDEVLLISGRHSVVDVLLEETSTLLSEVTLAESRSTSDPGLTTISIEKTMRIPANFFDPVRMTTSYPGVVAANDQANAIIIKGNSPNGLLWRLNGIDIVNPNHLSNAGTFSDKPMANGGGVNILSAQMLDRTDFHTGAFPVQYGNVISGVLDMNLRAGNNVKDEYTAQASLIGIDLSAEGPFTKSGTGSYLVNYRYSTVGLLSKLGVQFGDEDITFQDLSFNVDFPTKAGGSFTLFGLGGLSENVFKAKSDDEVEEDKDNYDIDYESDTYAVGVNFQRPLGKAGHIFLGAGYSTFDQHRLQRLVLEKPKPFSQLVRDEFDHAKSLFSSHLRFDYKFSRAVAFTVGASINRQEDALQVIKFYEQAFAIGIDSTAEGWLLQPYVNAEISLSPRLLLAAGTRYVNYTFNKTHAVDPRVSLRFIKDNKHEFSVAYRLTSQLQAPLLYLLPAGQDLGMTRAHHAEIAHGFRVNESTHLKTELYYQQLFDVPIGINPWFSAINFTEIETWLFPETGADRLTNEGTGKNYGVNLTLEKLFFGNHYFILGGAFYKSTFVAADGVERDSRFAGDYTFNATYGKEWKKTEKKRTIGLNTRLLYLGGLRDDIVESVSGAYPPAYTVEAPYRNKLKDYYRIDLRISFRKDKPGYTRTFAVDIQNLTSAQNEAYRYFDSEKNELVTKYQLGIIPVLVYRIDF